MRSSLPGRMRMTPRPGPESSATSSSAKRSIFPRAVATTTAGPTTGSTDTISSPPPTRARRRPARVVSERSGVAAEAVALRRGDEQRMASSVAAEAGQRRLARRSRLRLARRQPRRHDALAVAELEQRLHRLAVAGGRRHVGDAQHVERRRGSRTAPGGRASCRAGSRRARRPRAAASTTGPSPRARASASRRATGRRSRPRARCTPRGRTPARRRPRTAVRRLSPYFSPTCSSSLADQLPALLRALQQRLDLRQPLALLGAARRGSSRSRAAPAGRGGSRGWRRPAPRRA